ncbi:MAG: 50S ribosomal protein L5 [uncultured bacterium]|nr:MAG: 50S ribosomal protein L5 [uncultured bacterium]HLD45228.1 50S ribosomal protein L5 [bacterium]
MLLHEKYQKEIVPLLKEKLGITNKMLVPKLKKIVINTSTGEALLNAKILEQLALELAAITGQRPVITKSKKAIANFKLRQGMPLGVCVTLRGVRMYEFFNRLVNLALPRTRDFKGLSPKGFDGRGNYTLGISEQTIFPEIVPEKVEKPRGMNITIVTSSDSDVQARELLTVMGFPFRS